MSDTFSNVSTFEKKAIDRSISETVIPTVSTDCAIGSDAARGPADGSHQTTKAMTTISVRTSVHPFQQVIADAQRVGHDRQRRVHGAARREEAAIDDIQVVHVVCLAQWIERGGLRVAAEADRAVL